MDGWDVIPHTVPRTRRTELGGGGDVTAVSRDSGIGAEGREVKSQEIRLKK